MSSPVRNDGSVQAPKQGSVSNANEGALRGRNVQYGTGLGPVNADRFREAIGRNEIKIIYDPYQDSSEEELYAERLRALLEAYNCK